MLCPGKAYDRSPCGTGTSAKLACLAADGKLAPGETWVQAIQQQENVIGQRRAALHRLAADGMREAQLVRMQRLAREIAQQRLERLAGAGG